MGQPHSVYPKLIRWHRSSSKNVETTSTSMESSQTIQKQSFSPEDFNLEKHMAETESEWKIRDDQKALLRQSWREIQSSFQTIGVVTFLKLFETHPESIQSFIPKINSLKEIEMNEWYSENLKSHSLRVMALLEKVIHRLDDEKRAAQILMSYGIKHNDIGVKPEMLDKMGESFIMAVQTPLEKIWTKAMEDSWLAVFNFITFFMKISYPKSAISNPDQSPQRKNSM